MFSKGVRIARGVSPRLYAGGGVVLALVVFAVFAQQIAPDNPLTVNPSIALHGPSANHLLGTDELGRDILSRLIFGARISLTVAALATLIGGVTGTIAGLIAGFFGRWADMGIMRLADVILGIPAILLAIMVVAFVGATEFSISAAIGIASMPIFARVARSSAIEQRNRDYVTASQVAGSTRTSILLRHILPNALGPLSVQASITMATAVLVEAGLSFLGLGTPPPSPSWGSMVAEAANYLNSTPVFVIAPGVAITVLVIALNFLAQGLQDLWSRADSPKAGRRIASGSRGAASVTSPMPDREGPDQVRDIFSVRDLVVSVQTDYGEAMVVDGVTLGVRPREVLGIVGESGAGKSVSLMSALRLTVRGGARVASGSVRLAGIDITAASHSELRGVWGREVGIVFQDALTALNPVLTIGTHFEEAIHAHDRRVTRRTARDRAADLLMRVGVDQPYDRLRQYPHELSGGLRQRVVVALAVINKPSVIIADEPTTALDVTVQAQTLDLLASLTREMGAALIIVTHDLGVVAEIADRVAVMYSGVVVEEAPVVDIFSSPRHPYTRALLEARPTIGLREQLKPIPGERPDPATPLPGCRFAPRCTISRGRPICVDQTPNMVSTGLDCWAACHFWGEVSAKAAHAQPSERELITDRAIPTTARHQPVLTVTNVVIAYPLRRGEISAHTGAARAVNDVSFTVGKGETLGIVGESGCGKSSLARAIVGIRPPESGHIEVCGATLGARPDRARRRLVQMVFQDPYSSFDPRQRIGEAVAEPLRNFMPADHRSISRRVGELLELVGLNPRFAGRLPHELSGGERQRAAVARALAAEPALLVLDEPVSSLDVSLQAELLNLLDELQRRLGTTYVLIAHDLAVVRQIATHVVVMYLGSVVEQGVPDQIFSAPQHPYTQALLASVPIDHPSLRRTRDHTVVRGEVSTRAELQFGCPFRERCPKGQSLCAEIKPPLEAKGAGDHECACHFPGVMGARAEIPAGGIANTRHGR